METGHDATVESVGDNSVVDLNNPESEIEVKEQDCFHKKNLKYIHLDS